MNGDFNSDSVKVDSLIGDLVPGFIRNRRNELPLVEAMLSRQEFENLARFGHQLKGAGLNYGFQKLGYLGDRIEQESALRDVAALRNTIEEIRNHIDNVKIEFV